MTSFIQTNVVKKQSLKESSFVKRERAQIKSKTYEINLAYLSSRLFSRSLTLAKRLLKLEGSYSPPSLRLTERINSARYLWRSSGVIADNSSSSFFSPLKKSFKSFTSRLVFTCVFLFSRLSTYSSTEEPWITKLFSLMAFAETGTLNVNDGRNANKNYLLSSDSQSDGLCGVRNRANQP